MNPPCFLVIVITLSLNLAYNRLEVSRIQYNSPKHPVLTVVVNCWGYRIR